LVNFGVEDDADDVEAVEGPDGSLGVGMHRLTPGGFSMPSLQTQRGAPAIICQQEKIAINLEDETPPIEPVLAVSLLRK